MRFILKAQGRWNRQGVFGCLYTTLTIEGALAELRKAAQNLGIKEADLKTRELVSINVSVWPVLDLSSRSLRMRLGVRLAQLLGNDSASIERCRSLADWARAEGYRAILAPSAASRKGYVLAVFLEGAADRLEIDVGHHRLAIDSYSHKAIRGLGEVEAALGRSDRQLRLAALRQVLLTNNSAEESFMAAYHVTKEYVDERNFKKALFYARIAKDRALAACRNDWICWSYEQIGTILLAESFVSEATESFQTALGASPQESSLRRASLLDNLGYCYVLDGRLKQGLDCLYRSLRMLRAIGARRHEGSTRLSLSFAHLEGGRFDLAFRHAAYAYRLAELMSDANTKKLALYLLGETKRLADSIEEARHYFTELQTQFFPAQDYLANFFMSVDVRKLVNLKA